MARSTKVKLNNPALLRWARETAGHSVEEIADHLNKPPDAIHAWEEGMDAPTYRQLQAFAKKVRRPVAALYLPEVPEEPGPPQDFRVLPGKAPDTFTSQALLAFRELRNAMAELRDLLGELGDPLSLALPHWPSLGGSVVARARELRGLLGVTFDKQTGWPGDYEALNEWRSALFDRGVLVQVLELPIADVRAFSLLEYDLGGVGLSTEDPPKGRVFSLFHEVAHLCLHKPGVSGELTAIASAAQSGVARVERYCDAFAAALLLPQEHPAVSEAMQRLEGGLTLEAAQSYANRFKVSKYVIARRMLDLGKLEPEVYWGETSAWRQHDSRGAQQPRAKRGRPDHLRVKVSWAGKRYVAKVMEALERGVLTTYEAGKILSLNPDRLEDAHRMALAT